MLNMSALPPYPPASAAPSAKKNDDGLTDGQMRAIVVLVILVALALLAGALWWANALVNNPTQAATVRDVFIIFMAVESMVIGVALVILIVQLAVLTNMLRHEIKPILEATNETVNTVRGTTALVSENLVEPIKKLNGYISGIDRFLQTINSFIGSTRR